MLDSLWTLLSFVVAIGVLVTVHEFGHFYVARLCGVRVLRFSIGFGKALWSRTDRHGTEFVVAPIPLGGYVRMLDGRVDEVSAAERPYCFDAKPVGQRMAILVAGPAANLIFAIAALWLIFVNGVDSVKPVVGEVAAESIAARAGLMAGDQIIAVGSAATADWEAVGLQLAPYLGQQAATIQVVNAAGVTRQLPLQLGGWQLDKEGNLFGSLGITPFYPEPLLVLAAVTEGGAGQAGGLRVGDRLLSANGEVIERWRDWVQLIQANGGRPLMVEIERQGELLTMSLLPELREVEGERRGYLGVSPTLQPLPESMRITIEHGPLDAIGEAVARTWQIIVLIVSFLGKLITGTVGLDTLSGPIAIAQGAGASADSGWVYFVGFLALISINLGIINLVPLPVLDGGHLLFFLIEAIRGKAVPERIQELGFRLGWGILLALMCIALFNDITRL
ncbi:MAG: sigma E protease regulator RseP [Gammaproteobacteria bacterium]|nr:sigma E protease regulator RseP [Gammaproteobacteria bacterium]